MKKAVFIIVFMSGFGSIFPQAKDSIAIAKVIQYDESNDIEAVEFDKDKIENYRSQKDFDYINTVEKDNWWTRFKKWVNAKYNQFLNWLLGDYKANSILSFIIAALPFLLILLLLGLIAWLFSRLNPGGKVLQEPKKSTVFLSEEEELVKSEDLPALMKEAIKNAQFRLAVRYYYLNELRKLDELNIISYEYQKTNRDYYEEIKDEKIRQHFFEITKLYEFIWYGSFKVSAKDFWLAEKGFKRMENLLNTMSYE